jgi:hypothetical protein
VFALFCLAAGTAALAQAAPSTPTPGIVVEPALKARLDSGGNIAQVYTTFTLTNSAARPHGVAHAVSVTINHIGAARVRPDRRGGVRWTATLMDAAGQDFKIDRRYRVSVSACGSNRCARRTFTETLRAAH